MSMSSLSQPTDPLVRRTRLIGLGLLAGVLLWCAAHVLPRAFGSNPGFEPQPVCYT